MSYRRSMCLALFVTLLITLFASPASAQEGQPQISPEEAAMMAAFEKAAAPGPQHARLAAMAGDWKFTITSWTSPGSEPMVAEGSAVRTMTLGGRVLEERVTSVVMGMPFEGLGRTGYDNVSGKFWSTWTDNMSTGLMTMEGGWDDSGTATMEGEFSDPMTGQKKKARMVSKVGENRETSEFSEMTDGEWVKTMELVYERQ